MSFQAPSWDGKINILIDTNDYTQYFVSGRINSGTNYGPYKNFPQRATCVMNFYFPPGVSIPVNITRGTTYELFVSTGVDLWRIWRGRMADMNIEATLDQARNAYGNLLTIYSVDPTSELEAVAVPGVSTSAATKNESWERRIATTLAPYFPLGFGGTLPNPATEAHIYRLVDNNVSGSLGDQLNLACNSVGATWGWSQRNFASFYPKGTYPKSGLLFTDVDGYWNAGNRPANSNNTETGGVENVYNVLYSDINISWRTEEIINRVAVENVMPRNIILSNATAGVLTYKDPPTIRPENMEVIEPVYIGQNATSITSYGVRPGSVQTNVYPYRTTDTESFYVRFNGFNDPGIEYRSEPQVSCTNAQVRFSSTNPETGTYCLDVVTTAGGASYTLILGDPAGYPVTVFPVANSSPWTISWRTAQANARFQRGIQYLDSNGAVLLTQTSLVNTPTLNTWTSPGGIYMDYTTIPAGTVSWRPVLIITHSSGTFPLNTQIAKIDNISINPQLQQNALMSGDTADTNSFVYGWESSPGQSWSYQQRNVLDNIATDVLTYWKDRQLVPRMVRFNARQNWDTAFGVTNLARVDIRNNGTNYRSWIDSYTIDITTTDCIFTLELGPRPASWA